MIHLLIPYVPLADHPDPMLEEFTYGDIGSRGKKLKRDVKKGDYIFLHTSVRGKKVITAYYVVGEVIEASEAIKDREIMVKYRNPHLERYKEYGKQYEDDVIVIGDPIRSKIISPPLPFDRNLALKLSLNIPFRDDFTDNQNIISATRAWRDLTDEDIIVLLEEIAAFEKQALLSDVILSTNEVLEIREIDLENFIVNNIELIGDDLNLLGKQIPVKSGRIDLLFENKDNIVVVELKLNEIGRSAINQIRGYIRDLRKEYKKNVKGILICKDILTSFRSELSRLKDIQIYHYGWKLHIYLRELV